MINEYRFRVRNFLLRAQVLFVLKDRYRFAYRFWGFGISANLGGFRSQRSVINYTSSLGTLCFQLVTGGKVSIYLGSSFALIAPICLEIGKYGLAAAEAVYLILTPSSCGNEYKFYVIA